MGLTQTILDTLQRGKHGWAIRDTWELYEYLGGVIADMVEYHRDHRAGTPPELTEEQWNSILTRIIFGFRYLHWSEAEEEALPGINFNLTWARRRAVKTLTFELLSEWWFGLWD